MKNANDYPTDKAIALLLGGHTGAGKTTNLLCWPRPFVCDMEGNMKGAIDWHRQTKPDLQFMWDTPRKSKDGRDLEDRYQFDRVKELLLEAAASPDVGTICVDGFGRLCDVLKEKLVFETNAAEKPLTVGGVRVMTQSLWQPFAMALKNFVWDIRMKNKPLVVTTHLIVDENELNGVKEERVDVQGDLGKGDKFPKCFSDYWQAIAEPCSKDAAHPRGVKYKIRTAPTTRNPKLKSSFHWLPDEFEVGDAAFKTLLERVSGGTTK